MEILDLYDNKKRKLNKVIERSNVEPLDGEFKLSVHVWILNDKGELLIQKRNENRIRNPGKWAFTGGAVDMNEESLNAAIREVKEEIGIEVYENEIEFLISFKREKTFVDVWLVKKNISISEICMQPEEVSEVKWISINELEDLLKKDEFVKSTEVYIDILIKLLKRCHGLK